MGIFGDLEQLNCSKNGPFDVYSSFGTALRAGVKKIWH